MLAFNQAYISSRRGPTGSATPAFGTLAVGGPGRAAAGGRADAVAGASGSADAGLVEAPVIAVPELRHGGLLGRALGRAGVDQLAGGRLDLGLGLGFGGLALRDGGLDR